MKEIHRATGGPWGGIKVDDAFQEYILELFGFEIITSLAKNEVIELERSFESFKKKVGTDNTVYYMQLPLSLRRSPTNWNTSCQQTEVAVRKSQRVLR